MAIDDMLTVEMDATFQLLAYFLHLLIYENSDSL